MVRKHYQQQHRFDKSPIANVTLNLECRDEIVPILFGLQHLYSDTQLRRKAVQLIAADINEKSRRDIGRPGMDDWHVVVLAAVRLGCNFDYDKLQDQVENHRALRGIKGIGESYIPHFWKSISLGFRWMRNFERHALYTFFVLVIAQ
jgi:hypothetical protein